MVEENKSQKFRFTNIDEMRNYFDEVTEQNELKIQKLKKVFTTLNYIKHFLMLASKVTGCT